MVKSFRNVVLASIIFAACFALTTAAHAFKIGDVDVNTLISASERFDDNITSVKTNKISDNITSLTVGLNASAQGKTRNLSLNGSISHEFFSQEKQYDNTSENLSASYSRQFDEYRSLGLSESFTHAEDPQTFSDEFGQVGVRRRSYYLNRFGMDYRKDISKQFSVSAGYQNEFYNRAGSDSVDSALNGVDLRGDYSFSSATIVSSVLGLSQRQYDPGDNIYTTTMDAVLRQFLTKQFYADFMLGVSHLQVSGGDSYTEPRYQFSLTDEVSEKTRYSWSIQKQFTTNPSNSDVFDQWRTSIDLSHRVYQRLTLGASLFYGEGEYVGQNIKDKFTGANGSLEYELKPSTSVYLSNTYSRTASTDNGREYARNVITLGLRGRF
ncbi:MAG: outer membrane beta-barrel protein [Candidatus Omnitrophica bacterium]|nr:outer membrane beta-barrel protein [Candidatus Omnitrophota bacterium]